MSDRKFSWKRLANFAGIAPVLLCLLGQAQTTTTLYSHTFSGGKGSYINQTAPNSAADTAGAAGTAIWYDVLNSSTNGLQANGVWSGGDGDSALLPFTPQAGYVYTLTVSFTFANAAPASWVGAGFAQQYNYNNLSGGATDGRFTNSTVQGTNWTILTESTGNIQWFAGPATSPTIATISAFATKGLLPHTMVFTLDTTGSAWTSTCTIDGKQINVAASGSNVGTNSNGVYTYTTNPTITAVGLTQGVLNATAADVTWNSLTLTATTTNGRTTNPVSAGVTFSGTGQPLNSSFVGLSYEKQSITNGFFSSATNQYLPSLVNLFGLISPAVLRIGGGTSDQIAWKGISSGTPPAVAPMTPALVDSFTQFMKSLPSGWTTIYGINLPYNTPANAADEATYVVNDMGSRLYGFEIGNEPEAYDTTSSSYLAAWQPEEAAVAAITPAAGAPVWDQGKGVGGWMIDGPDQGNTDQTEFTTFTVPFSNAESGVASLLTQHYYVGTLGPLVGTSTSVMAYPNATLNNISSEIATQAKGNQSLGSRITEAGSISAGGILGMSNAFGTSLWALDFMLTSAQNGVQGINFHGGGLSPYSPINNNTTTFQITSVGPEFYAMKMFSMIPKGGSVVPATVALVPATPVANFSAYGIQSTSGPITAVLINKEVNDTVSATLNLGASVTDVELISLAAPNLFDNAGFTLGGAPITLSGTWNGGVEQVIQVTAGQLTIKVPPTTAYLLIPTTTAPPTAPPTFSLPAATYGAVQTVSIADVTPSSTIYYTTDGSTPTINSTPYTGPITVATTETINAIATAPNYAVSSVSSATYTIHILPVAATPTLSPGSGTFVTVPMVTISDTSPAVSIYYTLDGSIPSVSSTPYTGPIAVGVTETVNAIAIGTVANTYAPSAVGSASYVVNLPPPAFTITAANTTLTDSPGDTVSTMLTITANAAFNGTITFACSYYQPVGAACNFSPATVSVNALGTTTTFLQLTLPQRVGLLQKPGPMLPTTVLAGVLCLFGLRKRRRLQLLVWVVVSFVGMSMFSGCGSGTTTTTSSQFFVTATGNSLPVNAPSGATPTAVTENLSATLTIH